MVVTGAGSGMGRELVFELLRRGARVAAVDRNPDSLEETKKLAAAPDRVATFALSVTDRDAVFALPARVEAQLGPADAIVNCAGIIQPFVKLADLDDATIDRVFDVNFHGVLHVTRAFLPGLLRRPEGHVVNVSSMGGFLPVPGQTIYGASKAAVKLLTEGLYAELAGTHVHVTAVFPGAVATNIVQNSGVTIPHVGSAAAAQTLAADAAARQILDGMERNAFRVLVGRDAKMMDALYRLHPRRATELIARQMKRLLG